MKVNPYCVKVMKETELSDIFELSPVPMWVFDVATLDFLAVNLAAISSYGYTRQEFLSMKINDIRPGEDVTLVKKLVKKNSKTGIFYQNTFRHVRKNGDLIWVEIASNLITFRNRAARLVLATDITEKLMAQEALALNEQRFKALVQDGSDIITIIDKEFKYKYVSPASFRAFGVTPDFFIGQRAFAFIHPDDVERVEREALKIWEHKRVLLSPYRYRNISGGWIWTETQATNLMDDLAVQGIVCVSKDVTERINHEKLVQENIERYNIVSKATSDIIWDCNLETDTVVWNRAVKGILKYEVTNTSLDWWRERIHPDDRARVVRKFNEHVNEGIIKWEDEYRFKCGDDSYKFIFDRGFVLLDEKAKAYRMIGAMQDITKRKEEESWSKLLESVIVNTTDGVLLTDTDPDPAIIYVNDALVAMSGFEREELIGQKPSILHGNRWEQPNLQAMRDAIKKKEPCKIELINQTKDGKDYNVSINIAPMFEGDGSSVRWVSIQRDVSEQREYVEQIEARNKKLNQISWMQSHVARAPLARIMSLVDLLDDSKDEAEKKELMSYLKSSAKELDEIITAIANQT
jgi:PAS domain S-box-containing protein